MNTILTFLSSYWPHLIIMAAIVPAISYGITRLDARGAEFVKAECEKLRAQLHTNPVTAQLAASDALVDLMESYIPEVISELDAIIKTEISTGKISSLDWKNLGISLWSKARAEAETGIVNYMQVSGEKDGAVLAAIVAKKFFMKQSALQTGLILPHK